MKKCSAVSNRIRTEHDVGVPPWYTNVAARKYYMHLELALAIYATDYQNENWTNKHLYKLFS